MYTGTNLLEVLALAYLGSGFLFTLYGLSALLTRESDPVRKYRWKIVGMILLWPFLVMMTIDALVQSGVYRSK